MVTSPDVSGSDRVEESTQTPTKHPARGVKAVIQRVRPPRTPTPPLLDKILKEVRSRRPKADLKTIERAFEIADHCHAGQLRKSGDAFITHPLGVGLILAQLGMDEATVAAALLHDAVEDTDLTL